jgi:hypothetical protein
MLEKGNSELLFRLHFEYKYFAFNDFLLINQKVLYFNGYSKAILRQYRGDIFK